MTRVNLKNALGGDTEPAPETPPKAPSSPRKRRAAPKAPRTRKTAQQPAQDTEQAKASREPVVLGVETKIAKRVSLYLNKDDYDFIRYDIRGGDIQSVIRSLIACARADDRLATKVARLSRTAPRGGQ